MRFISFVYAAHYIKTAKAKKAGPPKKYEKMK
jgi:hypothetical protein